MILLLLQSLATIITPDKPREITAQLIIEVVSEHFHISVDQMISKTRSSEIARPRQIAMYLCRNELHESYPTLRDCFKRKDHSTVLYACERVENDMAKDPQTRAAVEAIKKLLRNR